MTVAKYQLVTPDDAGPVLRTTDNVMIPNDNSNRDWREYLNWRALGNVPDPVPPERQAE